MTRPAPRAMRLGWSFCRSRPITTPWIAACRTARPCPWSLPLRTADRSIPPTSWPRPPCRWRRCAAPRMPSSTSCSPPPPRSACPSWPPAFPRSYVDANREPYELDPGMFEGPLPRPLNHRTTRVAAGPRHDPAGRGQRRGDLSRPRPVRRDRAAAGNLLAALSSGPVDAGRADLRPVRRRPADRRPFHAVLGLGHGPARARPSRRHRAGRQSRRGLRRRT